LILEPVMGVIVIAPIGGEICACGLFKSLWPLNDNLNRRSMVGRHGTM